MVSSKEPAPVDDGSARLVRAVRIDADQWRAIGRMRSGDPQSGRDRRSSARTRGRIGGEAGQARILRAVLHRR